MCCRMQKNLTWDTLGFGLDHVAPVSQLGRLALPAYLHLHPCWHSN